MGLVRFFMKKLTKIIPLTFLAIILLLLGLFWFVESDFGQDYITTKIEKYLGEKLKTKVKVGKIRFDLPNWVSIENLEIEDKAKQDIINAKRFYASVDMLDLLNNKVTISKIELENAQLNITKEKEFNFDFIIDAFASNNTTKSDSPPLQFEIGDISVKKLALNYTDKLGGIEVKSTIGEFTTKFTELNPDKNIYHLANSKLTNGKTSITFTKQNQQSTDSSTAKVTPAIFDVKVSLFNTSNYQIEYKDLPNKLNVAANLNDLLLNKVAYSKGINIGKVQLLNSFITYDDNTKPKQFKGLDNSHLVFSKLNLEIDSIQNLGSTTSLNLVKGSLLEKSGLQINQISSQIKLDDQSVSVQNLRISTPKSSIENTTTINLGKELSLNSNLVKTQISMAEVFTILPDLAKNKELIKLKNDRINLTGKVAGKLNNLNLDKIILTGIGNSKLSLNGSVKGLPNTQNLILDLSVNEFNTTKKDILTFIPPNSIPSNITLPNNLKLTAKIKGGLDNLKLTASLNSDFGSASFDGILGNFVKGKNQFYDGKLHLVNFDVGRLIQNSDSVGTVTGDLMVKGNGIDPKTMILQFESNIESATYNNYVYNGVSIKGNLDRGIANIKTKVDDKNLPLELVSKIDFSEQYPTLKTEILLDSINLKNLNITAQNLTFGGKAQVDFSSTDLANPNGSINIQDFSVNYNNTTAKFDRIAIEVQSNKADKFVSIESPVLNAKLSGKFDFRLLKDIILTISNQYFKTDLAYKPMNEPFDLRLDTEFKNDSSLAAFVPSLKQFTDSKGTLTINSERDTTIFATLQIPQIQYDSAQFNNSSLKIVGNKEKLNYQLSFADLKYDKFELGNSALNGTVKNNQIDFDLAIKDTQKKIQHALHGNFTADNKLILDELILNKKSWNANPKGFIQFDSDAITATQFGVNQSNQKIEINSTNSTKNSPLNINIQNFDIKTLTTFLQDTTLANGLIDGNIILKNYLTEPEFTGDLSVKNLEVLQKPVGDVLVNADYLNTNKINLKSSILSDLNDIKLNGSYDLKSKRPLDIDLNINKLSAKTIEAFSFGELKNSNGKLNGNLKIVGVVENPEIDGEVKFDSVAFTISQLGSKYFINKENIYFVKHQIQFHSFALKDSLNQTLNVSGIFDAQDLDYNLGLVANDFMVLNSATKTNDYAYGKGYIDANIKLKGTLENTIINGNITVNPRSQITLLMPDDVEASEDEGIVIFKEPENKTATNEKTKQKSNLGYDVNLTIEADEKAELKIIIDEINGDFLKVKGKASLNTSVSSTGDMSILGSYEITEGSYDFSYQLLKYPFKIKEGSKIVWSGDPMKADIDITAVYNLTASPYDLVANELSGNKNQNTYKQALPFEVQLLMKGNLSQPQLDFNIELPELEGTIVAKEVLDATKRKLETLQNDKANMNKQVFALLVLKRFIPEQSTDFLSGFNAEAIARESVSKMISDQLDKLTNDLIKGVNIDLNLNSTQDYSSGKATGRTDLGLNLSKGFLNNRLTVSIGRNFELENSSGVSRGQSEIFDNVSVNYNLSKDGRYLFRAYRKNQYQAVLEGFIVETGISFAITTDFDKFNELFKK